MQRFEWSVTQPINPGEVMTLQFMARGRFGVPRLIGTYMLGLQLVVVDGQLSITDTLVGENNRAVPVSTNFVE